MAKTPAAHGTTMIAPSLSKIDKNKQRRDALELRKAGASYADIGDRLGISPEAASKLVNRALKKMVQDPVHAARQIEIGRMETLLMMAWAKAKGGDLRAIETCARLSERISSLRGLDAPAQSEVHHTHDGEVSHSVGGAGGKYVLVIDGETEDDYVEALKRGAGPTIAEMRAAEQGDSYDEEAFEAEVVPVDEMAQRRRRRKKVG